MKIRLWEFSLREFFHTVALFFKYLTAFKFSNQSKSHLWTQQYWRNWAQVLSSHMHWSRPLSIDYSLPAHIQCLLSLVLFDTSSALLPFSDTPHSTIARRASAVMVEDRAELNSVYSENSHSGQRRHVIGSNVGGGNCRRRRHTFIPSLPV
jgi:hypothetical protein